MKTIYDQSVRDELIERINRLTENSRAVWGKMNVYQMAKHCTLWEEMMSGKTSYKRVLIGRLFGKIALKSVIRDDKPLRKHTPTLPALIVVGDGDLASEKRKWIEMISRHGRFYNDRLNHPFFGKMTKEETGFIIYKHSDHHLRQFDC